MAIFHVSKPRISMVFGNIQQGEDVVFFTFFHPISQVNKKRLEDNFWTIQVWLVWDIYSSKFQELSVPMGFYCIPASNSDTPSAHLPVDGHASLKATNPENHRPWHGESTPPQRCTTCGIGNQRWCFVTSRVRSEHNRKYLEGRTSGICEMILVQRTGPNIRATLYHVDYLELMLWFYIRCCVVLQNKSW